jgi:hypothetical protein
MKILCRLKTTLHLPSSIFIFINNNNKNKKNKKSLRLYYNGQNRQRSELLY